MRFASSLIAAATLLGYAAAVPLEAVTTAAANVTTTTTTAFKTSTCPVTSTTRRPTTTVTQTIYTSTRSVTTTLPNPTYHATTYTSTSTYISTSIVDVLSGTTTMTFGPGTVYKTVTKSGPSTTPRTTFVPTTCGFTPVKSEYAFVVSTRVVKKSTVTTSTSYVVTFSDAGVYSTFAYESDSKTTATSTQYYQDYAYTTLPSKTVTTTYTPYPTATTIYQACGSDNVVARYPDGSGVSSYGLYQGYSDFQYVRVADAVACCAYCQKQSFCSGSIFFTNPTDPDGVNCAYIKVDPRGLTERQVCGNNSVPYGQVYSSGAQYDDLIISNGRCGQILFS